MSDFGHIFVKFGQNELHKQMHFIIDNYLIDLTVNPINVSSNANGNPILAFSTVEINFQNRIYFRMC